LRTIGALAAILAPVLTASAAEIGHYAGGFMNIRDYFLPPPGVYGALYTYYYTTSRLNDRDGDEIDSVTVVPPNGTPVTLDVELDVDMLIMSPGVIWVPNITVLGARYGVFATIPIANSSLNTAVSTASGRGGDVEAGDFNIGDMFIQPLWLNWSRKHWDATFVYGVYIPTGRYDTETFDLPGGQTVEAEDPDNIGFGFWTHQFQSAAAWYPKEDRSTAVMAALTFEMNSNKEDFDVRPGNVLSLNYGVSHVLPLKKDHTWLMELGLAGYDQWQVSTDHGDDVINDTLDEVHAIGGQLGVMYLPWHLSINSHYFYEYKAEDRTQGQVVGISFAKKFWGPKSKEQPAEETHARRWR
jgi:hypothetical protein